MLAIPLWHVLAVGAGGFVGAALRYVTIVGVQRAWTDAAFPAGTLVVNLAGCVAIGAIGGWSEAREMLGQGARLFLLVGVLGGFTTYSTFAWETFALWRAEALVRAGLYLGAHVVLGLLTAAAAFAAAHRLAS